jgi:transcriptional regulator with PAS, ATPase and Fis domain
VHVLISGESGTGKELFARAIHSASRRKDMPFVSVNCGAIPSDLVEAEFFGHTKGAFTGALQKRIGYFESANGGTIFLDEISELPLKAQVKLLRTIQDGTIQKIGASIVEKVDVRVIAATNRDLLSEVTKGSFREDLFHRLAVGVINLPPLRDREGDLNLLIDHFLATLNAEFSKTTGWKHKGLSAGARNLLLKHPWPGNVRELLNTLSRAMIWTPGEVIQKDDIQEAFLPSIDNTSKENILNHNLGDEFSLSNLMAEVAVHYLQKALTITHGNKSEAARLLGLPNYQTLTNWIKKYDLNI